MPLYVLYMSLAGIRPLEPGFAKCEIRPQLASLRDLDLVAHTVRGPIHLISRGGLGHRELSIEVPPGCLADLVVSERERLPLDRAPALRPSADRGGVWTTPGLLRYRLPPGRRLDLVLQHS